MSIFLNEEDKREESKAIEKAIEKATTFEGKYINTHISSSETKFISMLQIYDNLCEKNMPNILEWDHIMLYQHTKQSNPYLHVSDWKNFLLDARIKNWINEEVSILVRSKQVQMIGKLGEDRSTATVQAFSALMRSTEEDLNKIDDSKIFIYSFMPLSQEEKWLNYAQILNSIPDEIRVGLQHISPDDDD